MVLSLSSIDYGFKAPNVSVLLFFSSKLELGQALFYVLLI